MPVELKLNIQNRDDEPFSHVEPVRLGGQTVALVIRFLGDGIRRGGYRVTDQTEVELWKLVKALTDAWYIHGSQS